jgi:hypothetical protein
VDVDVWGADEDLDIFDIGYALYDISGIAQDLVIGLEHLPVAGYQWFPHRMSS